MNDLHKQSYAAAVQPLTSTNLEAAAIHLTTNLAQPPSPDALKNAVSLVINEEKDALFNSYTMAAKDFVYIYSQTPKSYRPEG